MNNQTIVCDDVDGCHSSHTKCLVSQIKTNANTYLNKNNLIIGKRCTGKTFFIINEIYYQLQNIIDQLFVISSMDESYRSITDKTYNFDELPNIYSHLRNQKNSLKKQTLIIIDGVSDDIVKSKEMKDLIYNGRHLEVTLIISSQYPINLTPSMRANMDNIMTASENLISFQKKLYEMYFGYIPTFNQFQSILAALKSYYFLMSVSHWGNQSNLHEKFGWYQAHQKDDLRCMKNTIQLDNHVDRLKRTQLHDLIERTSQSIDELIDIRNQLKNISTHDFINT